MIDINGSKISGRFVVGGAMYSLAQGLWVYGAKDILTNSSTFLIVLETDKSQKKHPDFIEFLGDSEVEIIKSAFLSSESQTFPYYAVKILGNTSLSSYFGSWQENLHTATINYSKIKQVPQVNKSKNKRIHENRLLLDEKEQKVIQPRVKKTLESEKTKTDSESQITNIQQHKEESLVEDKSYINTTPPFAGKKIGSDKTEKKVTLDHQKKREQENKSHSKTVSQLDEKQQLKNKLQSQLVSRSQSVLETDINASAYKDPIVQKQHSNKTRDKNKSTIRCVYCVIGTLFFSLFSYFVFSMKNKILDVFVPQQPTITVTSTIYSFPTSLPTFTPVPTLTPTYVPTFTRVKSEGEVYLCVSERRGANVRLFHNRNSDKIGTVAFQQCFLFDVQSQDDSDASWYQLAPNQNLPFSGGWIYSGLLSAILPTSTPSEFSTQEGIKTLAPDIVFTPISSP